jgi:hypothetical protein
MKALGTKQPYIKLHGITDEAVTINDQNVTLLADPGATLTRSSNGSILQIMGTSMVEIGDLQIGGAKGAGNPGIAIPPGSNNVKLLLRRATISGNEGAGISCQGGSLTVSRSTISSNQGGGISTGGMPITFDITNTFIYRNGNPTNATVGGASLAQLVGSGISPSRFEFNTVIDNQIKDSATLSGGVFCDQAGFTGSNNIIARNFVNGDSSKTTANTSGLCTYLTSTTGQSLTALKFRSPDNNPYDYHILPGSSAIGGATTPSLINIDFDNDPRPQNASDQGADQYKP